MLLTLAAISSAAMPKVLILQTKIPVTRDGDPNLPISNLIASEFDELAKLEAVVWGMSDRVFRAAVTAGKVAAKDDPVLADGLAASRVLGTEYILVTQAFREGTAFRARAEMFRGGKSVWKDDQNFKVEGVSDADIDASLRSLARTLVMRLDNQLLKGMESQKTTPTPDLVKGQAPPVVVVDPPKTQPQKKDNGPTLRSSRELLIAGKSAPAIVILRDAVDSDPLDLELRLALVDALISTDPASAAAEARNAANLLPESPDLRTMAARAWIKAGRPDEAQIDLNEAVARNPEATSTRLLLGEVGIAQLKPDNAIEHLSKAIEKGDSCDARFLRAIGYSLAGSQDPMKSDLDQMSKFEPTPSPMDLQRRYIFAADVLDQTLQADLDDMRSLIQRAIVKPNDKDVLAAVDNRRKVVRSRTVLGERIAAPTKFAAIREQRLLAYKLLSQALSDLLGYMAGGGKDALTDARINLGEAARNAGETRTAETKARAAA